MKPETENDWDNTKRAKRLIFIVVSQLRNADGPGFVKNDKDSNNNNNAITTGALDDHSDNSICLLV